MEKHRFIAVAVALITFIPSLLLDVIAKIGLIYLSLKDGLEGHVDWHEKNISRHKTSINLFRSAIED